MSDGRRRGDRGVPFRAPFGAVLRDTVTEEQLAGVWRRVKARGEAHRVPVGWMLKGALAGGALATALTLAVQAVRAPEHGKITPVAAAVRQAPLTLRGGGPLDAAALSATATPRNVDLSDGSRLEVARDARLEPLVASASEVVLRLAEGSTLFDIVPGGPRRWTIEAGIASVEVVGTRFVVLRNPDRVRVDVERGVVLVRGLTVPDGVARVQAGGSIEVHAAPHATDGEPSASATAPTHSSARARDDASAAWRENAARRQYAEAYAALGSGGVGRETARAATVSDLLALSDVARLSGHPAEAIEPLERILRDHAASPSASLAALTLGRTELLLGRPSDAARAFERALSLQVASGLEEDTYVRLVEAYARSGNANAAESAAARYRAAFPNGRRAADVERWTRP